MQVAPGGRPGIPRQQVEVIGNDVAPAVDKGLDHVTVGSVHDLADLEIQLAHQRRILTDERGRGVSEDRSSREVVKRFDSTTVVSRPRLYRKCSHVRPARDH